MVDVVVVGLICRDVVVAVDELPGEGSVPVSEREETLGGAANIAVAARQLGLSAGLVGVVGEDDAADLVLGQAGRDGIETSAVVRRDGGTTPLVVDVVEADGTRRLLEHVPPASRLRPADVQRAAPLIGAARAVVVDLQQPGDAALEAARLAVEAGALVVLDGAPDVSEVPDGKGDVPHPLARLLPSVGVLRADLDEAGSYLGRSLEGLSDVVEASHELSAGGPGVVALGAGGEGNVVSWHGGHRVYPLLGDHPVDVTGGGDAFVAGLVTALLAGADPETAGWWASVAAALTVSRLGGRPALDRATVERWVARERGR